MNSRFLFHVKSESFFKSKQHTTFKHVFNIILKLLEYAIPTPPAMSPKSPRLKHYPMAIHTIQSPMRGSHGLSAQRASSQTRAPRLLVSYTDLWIVKAWGLFAFCLSSNFVLFVGRHNFMASLFPTNEFVFSVLVIVMRKHLQHLPK